jgi:hypothetical protein
MHDSVREEIRRLADSIRATEKQLEVALAQRRLELNYTLDRGKARFEQALLERQRLVRTRLSSYLLATRPVMFLVAPVIYALIVPLVLLDLSVAVYQLVFFRACGMQRVVRGDYMAFDRSQLAYLNALEKLNCAYCSYANGLLAYVREVAARTEQYWCPIKHARRVLGAHGRYGGFTDFGDADAYRQELERLRADVRTPRVE